MKIDNVMDNMKYLIIIFGLVLAVVLAVGYRTENPEKPFACEKMIDYVSETSEEVGFQNGCERGCNSLIIQENLTVKFEVYNPCFNICAEHRIKIK